MPIIFYILLMLRVGRCTDHQNFVTKTVGVGQSVTLSCTHQRSGDIETRFWIKLVPGKLPEILGRALSFDYDNVNEIPHITFTREPERFILSITETKLSDTAFYYCLKSNSQRYKIAFLKGAFLRVEGAEPDITAVVQAPLSDPVRPGDSVSLQCSVLYDSESKTCPGGLGVYWFRAGSHESHPSVIYTHGNSGDECETSPEARSPQKCVYNFFKENISSSDAGTYHCAVATCGQMLFGNGTKLDVEGNTCDSQKDDTVVCLLFAALAINLILVASLLYVIRKKSCDCCKAVVTLQTDAAGASDDQQSQQRNEDSLVYAAPNFIRSKTGKAGRRNPRKEEMIYTDVRAL
ncbi:signal-regulatory protein beta-2-like [Chaetodon trifascialis]|uniref:signal-regulatory protein beta-2-like n=1 Tax=Chaetodon trifascialis TaxID=109706 RepID=UPI0039923397